MTQIPRTRDDIRLHKHTSIYDGGVLDERSVESISITSLLGGANVALLDADQTFTGINIFNGDTIFNGLVTVDTLTVNSSLEVADSIFRIIGSVDSTKKLAFEVDGFTAATTRTLTPQDTSYTIAGTNINNQRFTRGQIFFPSVDDTWAITVREGDGGGGGVAQFLTDNGAQIMVIEALGGASPGMTIFDPVLITGDGAGPALKVDGSGKGLEIDISGGPWGLSVSTLSIFQEAEFDATVSAPVNTVPAYPANLIKGFPRIVGSSGAAPNATFMSKIDLASQAA